MFAFTVIKDELKTYFGFSTKGYGDILLRHIGVCHPRVIYASGGICFLDKFIESERFKRKARCVVEYIIIGPFFVWVGSI